MIYGNVGNSGLIDNLPDGLRGGGLPGGPQRCAALPLRTLPEQLAALNRSHMAVHALMVDALLRRDRQAARYALMLDPLTAAVCSLAEIERLFEEMWEAERPYLSAF